LKKKSRAVDPGRGTHKQRKREIFKKKKKQHLEKRGRGGRKAPPRWVTTGLSEKMRRGIPLR